MTVPRRHILAAGAGLGAVALSGCSGSTNQSGSTHDPSAPSETGSGSSDEALVALDDIEVGEAVSATSQEDEDLIVTRTSTSDVACFSAICTHKGCTVKPAGDELHCPCHGSRYSAATGKVLRGPAPKPLPKVAVRVKSGEVVLR